MVCCLVRFDKFISYCTYHVLCACIVLLVEWVRTQCHIGICVPKKTDVKDGHELVQNAL